HLLPTILGPVLFGVLVGFVSWVWIAAPKSVTIFTVSMFGSATGLVFGMIDAGNTERLSLLRYASVYLSAAITTAIFLFILQINELTPVHVHESIPVLIR
ncbi:MAG: hypothetical protein KDD83_29525, partial [Caldilineaceae bacterium]|nr:hypothetical protein [Caldilineaceae bacterium]